MSTDKRLMALLARGYFPKELPPPFQTEQLAHFAGDISQAWSSITHPLNHKSSYEIYSDIRVKRIRRNLALVNPVAQIRLSKLIADEWTTIKKHMRKNSLTAQVPEIVLDDNRAIPSPDFPLVASRRADISANFDYALVADISRFYGTLYTHAVPWALHGKAWCKENLNKPAYKQSIGSRLDQALRLGQDNQSIGLPIGPDTSRILSEIIGVSIDRRIIENLKLRKGRGVRHIDDWYIGFDTMGSAEDAIAKVAAAAREYELELNSEKTQALHASPAVDSIWPIELREFEFDENEFGQARCLEHYFAKAFHYAESFPAGNVLDYAIRRTRTLRIFERNWSGYETFLLKAARANRAAIPSVAEILVTYKSEGFEIGQGRVKKFIEDTIFANASLGHHAEVAWCLVMAIELGLQLSKNLAKSLGGMESSVCALLALNLQDQGLLRGKIDPTAWLQSMNQEGLSSSLWLLAYEASFKGWLTGTPPDFVVNDSYFSELLRKNVSFYDKGKNLANIRSTRPKKAHGAFFKWMLGTGDSEDKETLNSPTDLSMDF